MSIFAEGREFLHIKQNGTGFSTDYISDDDNRIQKSTRVANLQIIKMNSSLFMWNNWVQVRKAGINEKSEKCTLSSVYEITLSFIMFKKKINQGDYQLDTKLKYVSEVNDFPGSYKPEGKRKSP